MGKKIKAMMPIRNPRTRKMTWTIKLSENGGISFKDGRLEMIGLKNQISRNEVVQRTGIRFLTQLGSNLLHPFDGFDLRYTFELKKLMGDGVTSSPEELIRNALRSTLSQDLQINWQTAVIELGKNDGVWTARIKFNINSKDFEMIEFVGVLGSV